MILDYLIRFVNIFCNLRSHRIDAIARTFAISRGYVHLKHHLYTQSDAIISDDEWNIFINQWRLGFIDTYNDLFIIGRHERQQIFINEQNMFFEEQGLHLTDSQRDILINEYERNAVIINNNELILLNIYFDNLQRRITWRRKFRRWFGRLC